MEETCVIFACEASETFRAVAPISGMIMQDIMDECNPESEVSIIEIHGTEDNVTYFDGDPNNIDGWGAYPSIPETISFFNNLFDLQLMSAENLPNIDTNDGSTVTSEKYGASNSCTEVWLYTVEGGVMIGLGHMVTWISMRVERFCFLNSCVNNLLVSLRFLMSLIKN